MHLSNSPSLLLGLYEPEHLSRPCSLLISKLSSCGCQLPRSQEDVVGLAGLAHAEPDAHASRAKTAAAPAFLLLAVAARLCSLGVGRPYAARPRECRPVTHSSILACNPMDGGAWQGRSPWGLRKPDTH